MSEGMSCSWNTRAAKCLVVEWKGWSWSLRVATVVSENLKKGQRGLATHTQGYSGCCVKQTHWRKDGKSFSLFWPGCPSTHIRTHMSTFVPSDNCQTTVCGHLRGTVLHICEVLTLSLTCPNVIVLVVSYIRVYSNSFTFSLDIPLPKD